MKERPILFSGPMVRAILAGTKTQTRRIMKPQPELKIMQAGGERSALEMIAPHLDPDGWTWKGCRYMPWPTSSAVLAQCPYGWPPYEASHLRVRETWAHFMLWVPGPNGYGKACYRADGDQRAASGPNGEPDRWRPSIHMPRWASRITLEVVSVRVERLQDISPTDAIAEGTTLDINYKEIGDRYGAIPYPVKAYADLWESINGSGSWDANQWVWVIEFRRLHGEGQSASAIGIGAASEAGSVSDGTRAEPGPKASPKEEGGTPTSQG